MNLKDINLKDIQEQPKPSESQKSKKGKGMMGDLAGMAMAAIPFIPKKYKIYAGSAVFLILYGTGSIIYDIIQLIKYIF